MASLGMGTPHTVQAPPSGTCSFQGENGIATLLSGLGSSFHQGHVHVLTRQPSVLPANRLAQCIGRPLRGWFAHRSGGPSILSRATGIPSPFHALAHLPRPEVCPSGRNRPRANQDV